MLIEVEEAYESMINYLEKYWGCSERWGRLLPMFILLEIYMICKRDTSRIAITTDIALDRRGGSRITIVKLI